jgi:microcystin-dependent protein
MTLTAYTTQGLQKAPVSTVYDSDQIGTVKAFAGKTVPTNWMLADGRALLRLGYPELFAAIGTAYGVGDGSTTFNLPDLRSRFLYGSASATLADLGTLGGEAVHQLLAAEAAQKAVTTAIETQTHTHALNWATTAGGSSAAYAPGGTTGGATQSTGPNTNHTHPIAGSDAAVAHNNLPPYVLIAQIIKVTGVQVDAGGALIGPAGNASVAMDTIHLVGTAGEIAFSNGWLPFDSSRTQPGFRKDPFGRVLVQGVVKSPGTSAQSVCFTLPPGYRPTREEWFAVSTNAGSLTNTRVEIGAAGSINITIAAAAGTYISLDGIEFDTETVTAFPTGPQGPKGDPGGNSAAPIDVWHALPYASAWADLGGGWQAGQYRRDPLGMVQIRGIVRCSANFTFNSTNAVIATLPVGARPLLSLLVDCPATDAGGASQNGHVTIAIATTGTLTLVYSSDGRITTGASGSYVSLEDIEFDSGLVTAMPTGPTGPQGPAGGPILQDEGAVQTARAALNFTGPNVIAADDAANNRTNVATSFPLVNALAAGSQGIPNPIPDGFEVYFQSATMAAIGAIWHLRYRAGSSSAYKWEFVGGGPLVSTVMGQDVINSAGAWVNIASDGPAVTLPLAGDWEAHWNAQLTTGYTTSWIAAYAGPAQGDGGAFIYAGNNIIGASGNGGVATASGVTPMAGWSAGQIVKLRYFATMAGQVVAQSRQLLVKPIRVG